jgi:tRNA (guanine-N7-)-methyltransferase
MPHHSRKKYYRSLQPLVSPGLFARGLDPAELFGRSAPLELEIGFGNGEFLSRESLKRPDADFVGIEIAWPSVKRALRRLGAPPRANVRLICLPARQALARLIPPESLSAVRALYPVPWPKHEKKRMFSYEFLELAASRMRGGALFHIVTDDLGLAEWTLAQSEGSPLKFIMEARDPVLNTKYERKWQSGGAGRFYHLTAHKSGAAKAGAKDLTDMKPVYSDSITPENFSPRGVTGEPSVVFGGFLFDQSRREGLLACKVVEDSFVQEFFIRVRWTPEKGLWKLYPAHSGNVFPTEGVQLALELAARGGPGGAGE